MADDIAVSPVAGGTPVATDELAGGRHAQLIKLLYGGDGLGTMVEDAAPLPVLSRFAIPTAPRLSSAPINVSASGDTQLLAGTALQTIRLWKLFLVVAAPVSLKFRSAANDLHPALPFVAGGAWILDFDGEPWFTTTVAEAFAINLSAAVQVSGRWYYTKSA